MNDGLVRYIFQLKGREVSFDVEDDMSGGEEEYPFSLLLYPDFIENGRQKLCIKTKAGEALPQNLSPPQLVVSLGSESSPPADEEQLLQKLKTFEKAD